MSGINNDIEISYIDTPFVNLQNTHIEKINRVINSSKVSLHELCNKYIDKDNNCEIDSKLINIENTKNNNDFLYKIFQNPNKCQNIIDKCILNTTDSSNFKLEKKKKKKNRMF